jgi:MFS transporter, FHS family, Na+ dependent glucose transporter 1
MMKMTLNIPLKTRQTIGYFGAFFCLGCVISSLGPALPTLAVKLGVGIGQIGILITARSFGYFSGSLVNGSLLDRFRGHRLMTVTLLMGVIAMNLLSMMPSIILLAVMMFLLGIGLGGMDVASNTLMAWTHKENSSPYLNAMFVFAGMGGFLTPLLLGRLSLNWGFSLIGVLLILPALWLLSTPSPAIPNSRKTESNGKHGMRLSFILFTIIAFLYVGYENAYGGWIFTYYMKYQLGGESTAYLITSAFWLALTFGRLLAIPITARVRTPSVIWGSILGAILSGILLVCLPQNATAIWIGTLGLGISTAAIFPTTFSYVQTKIHISGRRSGLVWAAGSLGAMSLPWGVGLLIESRGPLSLMITVLGIWGIALLIFWGMLRAGKNLAIRGA